MGFTINNQDALVQRSPRVGFFISLHIKHTQHMEIFDILEVFAQLKDFLKDMPKFNMRGALLVYEGADKKPGVPKDCDVANSFITRYF